MTSALQGRSGFPLVFKVIFVMAGIRSGYRSDKQKRRGMQGIGARDPKVVLREDHCILGMLVSLKAESQRESMRGESNCTVVGRCRSWVGRQEFL